MQYGPFLPLRRTAAPESRIGSQSGNGLLGNEHEGRTRPAGSCRGKSLIILGHLSVLTIYPCGATAFTFIGPSQRGTTEKDTRCYAQWRESSGWAICRWLPHQGAVHAQVAFLLCYLVATLKSGLQFFRARATPAHRTSRQADSIRTGAVQ